MTAKKKLKPAPHASPSRTAAAWKAPEPSFTRPSLDDRLLEVFHLSQSIERRLEVAGLRAEYRHDQVRAIALLAQCREVLRALVKLGPAVPQPKDRVGLEELPLELLQAAGELLVPINELLQEARR